MEKLINDANGKHEDNIMTTSSGLGNNEKGDKPAGKEEEEDWSEFMTSDLSGGSFAQHQVQTVQLSFPEKTTAHQPEVVLHIASTPALSPLDMMDLSYGTHDATGHRIWMGANLFLRALSANQEAVGVHSYLRDASVLELGTGTGLAGLAVAKLFHTTIKLVVLTDNSESALKLCRENVIRNGLIDKVSVEYLEWGNVTIVDKNEKEDDELAVFDTVIATDVIYDINAWEPLLQTAHHSLRTNGILILCHIPRATIPANYTNLETYLIDKANSYQMKLENVTRPNDLSIHSDEMEQAGAAILIFRKNQ